MKKQNIIQIMKFCIVGVMNTIIDYGVFFLALSVLDTDKSVAQIFATAVAMTGSYIVNRHWTFEKKGAGKKRQIAKFIATNLISMSFTIVFLHFFHDVIHLQEMLNSILELSGIDYSLEGDIAVMLCKVAASTISLIINFLGNKFWVFKEDGEKE